MHYFHLLGFDPISDEMPTLEDVMQVLKEKWILNEAATPLLPTWRTRHANCTTTTRQPPSTISFFWYGSILGSGPPLKVDSVVKAAQSCGRCSVVWFDAKERWSPHTAIGHITYTYQSHILKSGGNLETVIKLLKHHSPWYREQCVRPLGISKAYQYDENRCV